MTIIGVIAAITIPNLMQSWRKHEVEVKLKEIYSILSDAIKISEIENGITDTWNYQIATTNLVKDNLIPYLKVSKNCLKTDKNCFCSPIKTLNGWDTSSSLYRPQQAFTLANGMSLSVRPSNTNAQVYVDIDGNKKGKCKIGEDIFVFSINKKEYSHTELAVSPGLTMADAVPFQRWTVDKISDKATVGGCNLESSTNAERFSGSLCAAWIAKNGWKIPDDYPVKKF